MHYFSILFTESNHAWVQFLSVWMKNAFCGKFLRKLSKKFKGFLTKLARNALLSIFFTNVNKSWVIYLGVWTKKPMSSNFLRILSKDVLRKCRFFTKFKKPCVYFLAFGRNDSIKRKGWENLRFWKYFSRKLLKCSISEFFQLC